jgi:hypothetical protein
LFELLPGPPILTRDNLDSMTIDNVLSAPMAAALNLTPASLEAIAPEYLTDATSRGRFNTYRSRGRR